MSRGTSVRDPVGLDADEKRRRSDYHKQLVLGARASRAVAALAEYEDVVRAERPGHRTPKWLTDALDALRACCQEHADRADILGKHPAVSK